MQSLGLWRGDIPQRLEPNSHCTVYGMAEAVLFQNQGLVKGQDGNYRIFRILH
jgi:hypothetical protein